MTVIDKLVAAWLALSTPEARQQWVSDQREALDITFFEALKAQIDRLALQKPRQALALAEAAVQAAFFVAAPEADALVAWGRGNAYLCLGEYAAARADYEAAHAVYAQLDTSDARLSAARLQVNLVGVLKNLGRYKAALEAAAQARAGLHPAEHLRYLATLEMNLGSLYRLLGRYDEALQAYERGRAGFVALGNRVQAASIDINRAHLFVCLDQFSAAEPLLHAAWQTLTELEQGVPAARAQLNLATLYARQGRHRQALETYAQAQQAFVALGVATDVAVVELYRTYDYLALNLLPEAVAGAEAALAALAAQTMPRYVALAHANWAVAARKQGRYTEALSALASAAEIFTALGAPVELARLDVEQALCQLGRHLPAEATTLAERARKVFVAFRQPLGAAQAQLILAQALFQQGQLDASETHYAEAGRALADFPTLAWQAHAGLGGIAEARQNFPNAAEAGRALACYRTALEHIEAVEDALGNSLWRAGFLEDKLNVYQRAVRLALALRQEDTALAWAERAKTGVWRAHLDAAPSPGADVPADDVAALRQQWHWLYQRLTQAEVASETDAPQADTPDADAPLLHPDARGAAPAAAEQWQALQRLERELLHRQAHHPPPASRAAPLLAAVQAALRAARPADVWLLDFYCTDTAVNAFVVRPDGLRVQRDMAPRAAVLRALNRWRFNMESVRVGLLTGRPVLELADEAHALLQQLYGWLFAPLAIPAGVSLWVLPDTALWATPFAALYDGARYAIERWPLTYLPGLPEGAPAPCATETLAASPLVVGHSGDGRLNYTLSEAQRVAGMWGTTPLLEAQATRAAVQAAAARSSLVHLATHGYFRADSPLFSTLQLADGVVTAESLADWSLGQAALVTLSACETGLQLTWGSDVLGLARGLWQAGARRLVLSQWAVDDAATAELMAHFYRRIHAGDALARALQQAQLAVLAKYRHPFYWASFALLELH